jgi:signal transduction histidine kinase
MMAPADSPNGPSGPGDGRCGNGGHPDPAAGGTRKPRTAGGRTVAAGDWVGSDAGTPTDAVAAADARAPTGSAAAPGITGLAIASDPAFAVALGSLVPASAGGGGLHLDRAGSLAVGARTLRLGRHAFALLDGRASPAHAAGDLAALQSYAPRIPVVVCLDAAASVAWLDRLVSGGAFDVLFGPPWPMDALCRAVRHAGWLARSGGASAIPCIPAADLASLPPQDAAGFAEPDRPLLAEVSHEMRSPLASIIGFAASIEQESLGPWPGREERYRDYARHIRNSGEHLLALFDDLLQIGDAPRFDLEMAEGIDPAMLAETPAAMIRPAAEQKGVRLACVVARPALPIQCNPRMLTQALLNLLQNAVKYTQPGGSIALRLDQNGATAFAVTDSGIGFLPGRLAEPRQPRRGGGHGLGLRFVERVTAAHRGRLEIDSAPGKGTRIRIVLSATAPPAVDTGNQE